MSSEELLITLGVQDKGSTSKIKALNSELKSLNNQYKVSQTGSKGFESSLSGLGTKLTLLNQKYEVNKAKLSTYKAQLDKTKASITNKKNEIEKLKSAEGDNTAAIQKAEAQLSKYQQQMHNTENAIAQTEAEMASLTSQINATRVAIQNFNIRQFGENLQVVGDKMIYLGNGMKTTGTSLMYLSAPLVALGGYAIKTGMDFESSMKQVQSTSSASTAELETLTDAAIRLGEEIKGASAKEVADSFNYLSLAGYNVNQMLSAIEPNVKASLAFNSDMATTTDLVTDSLSALGLQAEDTSHYLDVVAQTSRNANTSGIQMLEAYIGVGGMFRDMNVPLEESAALIGILANRGIKSLTKWAC